MKPMSDLEETIKKHRESFDNHAPVPGHLQRFELKRQSRKKENTSRDMFWRIAAAAIVFAVVAISVWLPREKQIVNAQHSSLSLSDISEEFGKVETYYSTKIDLEYENLQQRATTDAEAAAYLSELDKLQIEYTELEQALYRSGGHEKVITSMIENFRLRLELIKKIKNKQEPPTQKTTP
jgi:hypothetical protein